MSFSLWFEVIKTNFDTQIPVSSVNILFYLFILFCLATYPHSILGKLFFASEFPKSCTFIRWFILFLTYYHLFISVLSVQIFQVTFILVENPGRITVL